MFIWLGVALIVDTIDGPLARRVSVTKVLPRWSGERLDLIVDFLTYVMIPAFALSEADLLPASWRLPAGIAVVAPPRRHRRRAVESVPHGGSRKQDEGGLFG